jgi:hypothetical protein
MSSIIKVLVLLFSNSTVSHTKKDKSNEYVTFRVVLLLIPQK